MKRTILAAFVLALTPMAAAAFGCSERTAMSCPEGQSWDAETKSCVIHSS
ncbi:hypothetical protein [Pseudothioclava nitratireducens]|jgi:hypothetical protein|nr:hypothetical protein [Defluviimonas nitratireducens]MDF1620019.1 hypothetical protein [Defluviimonas nitratireducens]